MQHNVSCTLRQRKITCSTVRISKDTFGIAVLEAAMFVPKIRVHWLALLVSVAALALLIGCPRGPSLPDAGLNSFSADRILGHIRTLSSDEFEGRGPGSKGEQITIKYLEDQFRSIGAEPGNPDGTFLQNVVETRDRIFRD
jgi:hypothetical protein